MTSKKENSKCQAYREKMRASFSGGEEVAWEHQALARNTGEGRRWACCGSHLSCQRDLQHDHIDPRTKKCQGLQPCTDFGWDRVKFLYGGLYGAVLWICAENNVDDRRMFLLLLSSAYTASRPFLLLKLALPASRLGVHKQLGGDTAGTADPNWPKGYPTPYNIVFSNKTGGVEAGSSYHCMGTHCALVSWSWSIALFCITCFSWVLFSSLLFFSSQFCVKSSLTIQCWLYNILYTQLVYNISVERE